MLVGRGSRQRHAPEPKQAIMASSYLIEIIMVVFQLSQPCAFELVVGGVSGIKMDEVLNGAGGTGMLALACYINLSPLDGTSGKDLGCSVLAYESRERGPTPQAGGPSDDVRASSFFKPFGIFRHEEANNGGGQLRLLCVLCMGAIVRATSI